MRNATTRPTRRNTHCQLRNQILPSRMLKERTWSTKGLVRLEERGTPKACVSISLSRDQWGVESKAASKERMGLEPLRQSGGGREGRQLNRLPSSSKSATHCPSS